MAFPAEPNPIAPSADSELKEILVCAPSPISEILTVEGFCGGNSFMGVRTTIVPVSLLWFLTFPTFPHAFTNAGNAASTLNGIFMFELL